MTLQAMVSRLDDYSGELAQTLEKLEIERSRGALNRDEQLDFLADLRRAMVAKDQQPLKKRGTIALLVGLVVAGGAYLVPATVPNQLGIQWGALGAALLLLGIAGWNFSRYVRVRRRDDLWLGRLEAAAAKGGTVFDVA